MYIFYHESCTEKNGRKNHSQSLEGLMQAFQFININIGLYIFMWGIIVLPSVDETLSFVICGSRSYLRQQVLPSTALSSVSQMFLLCYFGGKHYSLHHLQQIESTGFNLLSSVDGIHKAVYTLSLVAGLYCIY